MIELLECTLRDGSYAVHFRFTERDTAFITRELSQLGFRWIEIGHGVGMSASEKGKGEMPASDLEFLKIAKGAVAPSTNIGMFCIPGIATLERLKELMDEGLDFVRIGIEPGRVQEAYPFIQLARKQDLFTVVNFMKSYSVPSSLFAQKVKAVAQEGAQCVYVVDSAGCMLPHEVREYLNRTREVVQIKMGFHGHDNLHLAVANSLTAIECGAEFIDTTLMGLGRSSGNAPTEVMIAHLKKQGIETGIDFFKLIEFIEKAIFSLVQKSGENPFLSLVMGYSKFHSSYLPAAQKIATQYRLDLKKVISKLGHDKEIHENTLIPYFSELRETLPILPQEDILSFESGMIREESIATGLHAVQELMKEMINVSEKKKVKRVVELKSVEADSEILFPEYIDSDSEKVMGRIQFGSLKLLQEVLPLLSQKVDFVLIDQKFDYVDTLSHFFESPKIIFHSLRELKHSYFFDILCSTAKKINKSNLLLCGDNKFELEHFAFRCKELFNKINVYAADTGYITPPFAGADDTVSNGGMFQMGAFNEILQPPLIIFSFLPLYRKWWNSLMTHIKSYDYLFYPKHPLNESMKDKSFFKGEKIELDMKNIYRGLLSRGGLREF